MYQSNMKKIIAIKFLHNFSLAFARLSFHGIALFMITMNFSINFVFAIHPSSLAMSFNANCINGWLGFFFLHFASISLSPLFSDNKRINMNKKKARRRKNIVFLIPRQHVYVGFLLSCISLWNGHSIKACNAICVLLLLQRAPQLHPSNNAIDDNIWTCTWDIYVFLCTLWLGFSCDFLPCISTDVWCGEERLKKNNFTGKCRSIGVIVNYVTMQGARSNFGQSLCCDREIAVLCLISYWRIWCTIDNRKSFSVKLGNCWSFCCKVDNFKVLESWLRIRILNLLKLSRRRQRWTKIWLHAKAQKL